MSRFRHAHGWRIVVISRQYANTPLRTTTLPSPRSSRVVASTAVLLAISLSSAFALAAHISHGSAPGPKIDFLKDVQPILAAKCVVCHGPAAQQGGLRLDTRAATLRGSADGKVVIPGDAVRSVLVRRLTGIDQPRMPMGQPPLSDAEIATIRAWIAQGAGGPENDAAHGVDFARDVQPILAANCYACHGSGPGQAGLRLDTHASILKGASDGKVVLPGDSARSPLIRRLLGADQPRMPFNRAPLTTAQIATIRTWIDQGAKGPNDTAVAEANAPKHWAYVKPVHWTPPAVKNRAWVRNAIDNFVLAKLEKGGLTPSPEASRETLIRRVSLDLIGLPPTPEEVDAFVRDRSPHAYEKLVDRLLASPHYGERWARPWLDLARYADTNGYEKDDRRTAWKFRDWVINALNQDMSFREFTIEQIAGDMLPDATDDQKIASGFERNTLLNQEGGIDVPEARWEMLVDRVNTMGTVWLGSTVGCAQCHNHKFDPFTQRDYYRFMAFFDNEVWRIIGPDDRWVDEPDLELPTPEQAKKAKQYRAEIARLQDLLTQSTPELETAQSKWEADVKRAGAEWTVLRPERYRSLGGATLTLRPDLSIVASGKNPLTDTYVIQARTNLTGITGVRVEVLPDRNLPNGGPGRDREGNFFLSEVNVQADSAEAAGSPVAAASPHALASSNRNDSKPGDTATTQDAVKFKEAIADDALEGYGIKHLLGDHSEPEGWVVDISKGRGPRQAVLVASKPFGFADGTVLTIRLKHEMPRSVRNVGRFRLSVTTAQDPRVIASAPIELRPLINILPAKRTEEQKARLAEYYRSIAPALQPTRDQIEALEKKIKDLKIVTAQVMTERPGFERPSSYIRIRGSYYSPGDKVYAGTPDFLHPFPQDQMPNRLGLAYWLVSEDNPLVARVAVNRFWEQMFGRGIVETSEDFGTQGTPPTHPELLDWLATEFMRDGWSMKKIQRLIVTSATYRQSSRATPELIERDPYNKLLARGPRFRVEAEMVRDIDLKAGGLLSEKIGGPSVMPYQPEGIWDMPYNDDRWVMSQGEDRYRRGLYTFVRRTAAYPSLTTFDAPTREFCTVRRVRTNTPLQALTTLNDPGFFEAAQALGRRMMRAASGLAGAEAHLSSTGYGTAEAVPLYEAKAEQRSVTTKAQSAAGQPGRHAMQANAGLAQTAPRVRSGIEYGYRLCTSRYPEAEELRQVTAFYNQQLARYQNDRAAAEKLIGVKRADAPQLAAWTMVANVLLNLDETITKE